MDILGFLLGAYIMLESIYAAQHLDNGGRICQFLKYLSSAVAGAMACYLAIVHQLVLSYFIALLSIALCLWPSTYYRFVDHFDRRWRA